MSQILFSIEVNTAARGWVELPGYLFQGGGDPQMLLQAVEALQKAAEDPETFRLVRETRTREELDPVALRRGEIKVLTPKI